MLNAYERATRALRTLSAGNSTLLRAADEHQLLHDMCEVIVDKGGYRRAGVAYAKRDDAKSIHWMVWLGIKEENADVIELPLLNSFGFTWADTSMGRTAIGTAIRSSTPCVGRNILTEPLYMEPQFKALRKHALKGGYASTTALPLLNDGTVLGALFIAAAEPDAFDDDEIRLLTELADDLAYGISALRIREKHRAAQSTIERLAFYDSLTGLPNRTRLLQQLADAIEDARETNCCVALLHLEIDRFQEINKVFGYRAGDKMLQEIGQRLATVVPQTGTLARMGTAEFSLLLPNGGVNDAMQMAHRLTRAVDNPIEVSGVTIDVQMRIGIALFPDHADDAETLAHRANAAMHQAKPDRRISMYTGNQEQDSAWRLALMSELRRAIGCNDLLLYCQPKVDIHSRRVTGAEALVRWEHPNHGMVPPAKFIRLAEQCGMITQLTNWLLEAAFRQVHVWQENGLKQPLSINLSAYDLHDPDLLNRIEGLFSLWSVRPALIQFELTESALIDDPKTALETLARLKDLGVQILIDDFGTGYSSLSYLQKFSVDAIKIDQSFVMPMVGRADSEVIVRSAIELAHNLGLDVVAEGVENEAIWQSLEAHRCDAAQGYFISMPMPIGAFEFWESRWRAKHDLFSGSSSTPYPSRGT
jgi:diguanylate cyclase (GGDEF)-like protein